MFVTFGVTLVVLTALGVNLLTYQSKQSVVLPWLKSVAVILLFAASAAVYMRGAWWATLIATVLFVTALFGMDSLRAGRKENPAVDYPAVAGMGFTSVLGVGLVAVGGMLAFA